MSEITINNDKIRLQEEKKRLTRAVNAFAKEMKKKLHEKAEEGLTGWDDLKLRLLEKKVNDKLIRRACDVSLGGEDEFVDVANLAMMLWFNDFNVGAKREIIEG